MTMLSRSHNKKNISFFLLTFGLVAIVIFGILFSGTLFRLASLLIVSFALPPSNEYMLLPKNILASRLSDTERELSQIRYQSVLFTALLEENQRLADELELREPHEVGIGRVISYPPRTHYDTLLVSLKDEHAISKGNLVLFENILLGTVERTASRSALVSLFTSPGTTFDVRVGEPSAIVIAQGLGGGTFIFDVPNEIAIDAGDTVLSVAYGTRMVGVVQSITEDPDRTSKRVHAHSGVSLSDVRFVHFIETARTDEEL